MIPQKQRKPFDSYLRYSNLAFQMAAVIGLGVFAGVRLDRWLELSFPACTLVLSLLSVVASIYLAVRDFLKKP
ncbi:MAG TPA: AtpZ/AtpI family protein [Bacteroidales bacterium]|nr:AtpZ/AtpI family protein [Bacteroidales bacterium]